MDDKKSLKVIITNLSGRRKLALALALVVIGGGVSDLDFLNDSDVAVSVSDATGDDSFDEIEAMLAEFESSKNSDAAPAEPPPSAEPTTSESPFVATNSSTLSLTIPQASASGVPVRNASYPAQTTYGSNSTTFPASDGELCAVAPVSPPLTLPQSSHVQKNQPAKTTIRLTGSIFPSP